MQIGCHYTGGKEKFFWRWHEHWCWANFKRRVDSVQDLKEYRVQSQYSYGKSADFTSKTCALPQGTTTRLFRQANVLLPETFTKRRVGWLSPRANLMLSYKWRKVKGLRYKMIRTSQLLTSYEMTQHRGSLVKYLRNLKTYWGHTSAQNASFVTNVVTSVVEINKRGECYALFWLHCRQKTTHRIL
jgi:hypothetical protein